MGILHFILNTAGSLALLSLVLISAFGFGWLILFGLGFRDRRTPFLIINTLALGFGMLGILVFAFGALRLLYQSLGWTLIALGVILSLIEIWFRRGVYSALLHAIRFPCRIQWATGILLFLLLVNLAFPLLSYALIPPVMWDEVAYHLAIPKNYLQNQGITYIPFIPYSNWPLQTELLFTFSLLLGSESLAHLVSWSALVIICAALFLYGRKYFSPRAGLLAAVIFTSTPMVLTLAGTALIELNLALYTLLACLAWLDWLETNERRHLLLSAIFGGLAASTKLNAALVPLILGILLVGAMFLYRRARFWSVIKFFFLYGFIAFLVVTPWYLKAWVQTGNPFWPFLQEWIPSRDWDTLGTEYLLGFIRKPNLPFTIANWLTGLWHLTVDPAKFGPYRVSLGWHYLVFLPFVLLALIRHKKHTILRWLGIFSLVLYTSWFFQTHQARFLLFATPIMALLAAGGLEIVGRSWRERWTSLFLIALMGFLVTTNWLASSSDREMIIDRWPYLTGQLSRAAFLSSQIPGYETYVYANQTLPGDAVVWLALYESRGYFLDREYLWANPISQRAFPLEGFTDASKLAEALRERGVTHILFRSAGNERYLYIRYGAQITELVQQLLADHTNLLYQSSELALYELRP